MFVAICSREKNQKTITADEAYSKVFGHDDWGFFQARDGWICPECKQPVFLKGPHERVGKGFSFVVQAHFCHHSAAAAANCALFKTGGRTGQNQAGETYSDRQQSLKRFFSESPNTASFIANLIAREEDALYEAVSEIGFRRRDYYQPAKGIDLHHKLRRHGAESIHEFINQVDSFHAGTLALGVDHRRKVRDGFLAIKGRKNRLRSLFIEFGKNRKKYFQLLSEAGLMKEHDDTASRLFSKTATEIEAAANKKSTTQHGAGLALLDNALCKLGLAEAGERSFNLRQYFHTLPILGNRLEGFETLNSSPALTLAKEPASKPRQVTSSSGIPCALPPIRITRRGLLVEARIIEQLVSEGSKRNGLTTFLRPEPNAADNHYIVLPGDQCILLTSFLHTNLVKGSKPHPLEEREILSDPDLPKMLWHGHISLSENCEIGHGIFIKKEELAILKNAMETAFGNCEPWRKSGLRYRRVQTGLRISMHQPQEGALPAQ